MRRTPAAGQYGVDLTVTGHHIVKQCLLAFLGGYVYLYELDGGTASGHFCSRIGTSLGVDIGDNNPGSFGGVAQCARPTQPTDATSNDSDFIV
jgi:hypothetical protein